MNDVDRESEWLRQARVRLGWSASTIASKTVEAAAASGEELSLTQQSVSFFEKGGTKSVPRWLRFTKAAVSAAEGGTTDEGSSPTFLTVRERTLLRSAEGATDEQLHAASDFLRGRVDAIDASASAAEQLDAVLLPEIDVAYSMGAGANVEDYPVTQLVPFSRAWLDTLTRSPASQLFVARGEGDSMMPTILDQDIVIIDRSERRLRGQDRIWAIAYGGFGMIKRLRSLPSGALQINSDNPAVTPIEAFDDEAHIIGRVVGIVRRV